MVFPLRSSIVLLAVSMMAFMLVMPYAEASEQTILQRVVPYHRQGRVFGFAQSVEQAASPLTAFLIAPITQLLVIPFMTDGWGAEVIGPWFGTGPDRGIALVFVVAGIIGAADHRPRSPVAPVRTGTSPRRTRHRWSSAVAQQPSRRPGEADGPRDRSRPGSRDGPPDGPPRPATGAQTSNVTPWARGRSPE